MALIWSLLALTIGLCVAMQGALNTSLSARIGIGSTLLINSIIVAAGSAFLFFILPEQRLSLKTLTTVPWYELLGGICGFLVIFLAVILFPRLGAGLTLVLAVAAQLIAAVVLDHFGILGIPQHPITLPRIIGVVLLVAGAVLVKLF